MYQGNGRNVFTKELKYWLNFIHNKKSKFGVDCCEYDLKIMKIIAGGKKI